MSEAARGGDLISRYSPPGGGIMPASGGGSPTRSSRGGGESLADVLDRVLDKGVVIAGDIKVNLLDIELLTIKIRLLIASADKAREMGIDWWAHDPELSSKAKDQKGKLDVDRENRQLRERVEELESRLNALSDRSSGSAGGARQLPPQQHREREQPGRRARG
jgi:hypothetical protein